MNRYACIGGGGIYRLRGTDEHLGRDDEGAHRLDQAVDTDIAENGSHDLMLTKGLSQSNRTVDG